MTKQTSIPMVKVIYKTANRTRHTVYGATKPYGGRSIAYGWHKDGDVFNVAEADVLVAPGNFNAYPCDEPFKIDKGKLTNPCGERKSEEKVGGVLEDIPGIGPRLAKKMIDSGLDTPEKVAKNLTPEVMKELKVPPLSRTKITEWQESQTP